MWNKIKKWIVIAVVGLAVIAGFLYLVVSCGLLQGIS
jgi:hypothetical protein